ncbi:MAG: hypothetical protein Satyrvirus13_17 [Satyrvirus sp.]|uniref:Uncharacterized protein n=1 Tax=Satyrvirus sp. TaxID=2487771 RepID=A0A3G5AFL9_9VIRU|nr:MAG: hypothetical protein Satyrvirus13_17 [Satyrvirus sp.]
MKQYGTGTSNIYTTIKILSIIILVIISYLFLKEKISLKNVIGILFGIVALILLTKNTKQNA